MSQFHRNGRMGGLALVMWQVHVTLFASWGNRFEAQRRPAERRVDDQGMPMTETRLDVLCLNSCLHPPANSRYLAEVKQFYVSRMHTFWGEVLATTHLAKQQRYAPHCPHHCQHGRLGLQHANLQRACAQPLLARLQQAQGHGW